VDFVEVATWEKLLERANARVRLDTSTSGLRELGSRPD
jgi:hypothetical protein